MELSQTALATLILGGLPTGILLNVAYRFLHIDTNKSGIWLVLGNIRDFLFMILVSIITVLLVYYVNEGDYRYQVIVGIACGFGLSELVLGKLIVRVRDTVFRLLINMLALPVLFLKSKTIDPLLVKVYAQQLNRYTELRAKYLMQSASNGFENFTEAKE